MTIIFGIDVGRGGDKTVVAIRDGMVIKELVRWSVVDTMVTVGRVVVLAKKHKPERMVIDVVGIGAGVVDRLREMEYNVTAFNAGERSTGSDKSGELGFVNKRSEAWWRLREYLDPSNNETIALPEDDLLLGDLCAPKWRVTSTGKIQVESKEEVHKRIGRSTDSADAVMMCFDQEGGWWAW